MSNLNTAYKARKRRMNLGMEQATQMKPGQGAKPGMNVLPKNGAPASPNVQAKSKPAVSKTAQVRDALAVTARRGGMKLNAPSPFKSRRKRAR